MGTADVIILGILFLPPVIVFRKGVQAVKRVRYSLIEILMLPLALAPTIWTGVHGGVLAAMLVTAYTFSFGLWLWALKSRDGWVGAFHILGGVALGLLTLVLWFGMIAIVLLIVGFLKLQNRVPVPYF